MIDNAGIMLLIHIPPYGFSFGIHPLHWEISQLRVESKCVQCGGLAQANLLRFGPLTFVVTRQLHGNHDSQ